MNIFVHLAGSHEQFTQLKDRISGNVTFLELLINQTGNVSPVNSKLLACMLNLRFFDINL